LEAALSVCGSFSTGIHFRELPGLSINAFDIYFLWFWFLFFMFCSSWRPASYLGKIPLPGTSAVSQF